MLFSFYFSCMRTFFSKYTLLCTVLFCAVFTLIGCQDPIVVQLNDDIPRMVIEGALERKQGLPDSAYQKLVLRFSQQFYDQSRPRMITDAQIVVLSGDGRQTAVLAYNSRDSVYDTRNLVIRAGMTYTTRITWRGDVYETTDELMPGGRIDSIYTRTQVETLFQPGGIIVLIDYTDPVQFANHYQLRLLKNGRNTTISDGGNQFTLLRNDEFFNGLRIRALPVNDEVTFVAGDTAQAEVVSLTKPMYDFYFTAFSLNRGAGLFNPPPAGLPSNLRNTTSADRFPLGYMGVVDVTRRTLVIR
jgi:hypothetical protein